MVSAGLNLGGNRRVSGGLRWRYFGARNLVDDGSVRSNPTGLLNGDVTARLSSRVKAVVSIFNATNASHSDIEYYFASRLPNEPWRKQMP